MSFGKNLLRKLTLALAMVVPAMAADVAPLYFDGIDDSKQQGFWEDLMKYKMFGAHGINFSGQQILVPDKSGWFGTADGNLDLHNGNNKHTIGGPVLVGGNLIMSDGNDSLTSGPVRVLGNITINQEANWRGSANLILGTQCVKGTANNEYLKAHNDPDHQFVGAEYENCPSTVPQINTDLRIPKLGANEAVVYPAIETNNNRDQLKGAAYPFGHPTIDVPKGAGTYDIIIDHIQFTNENLLEVRMPYGGRLTRIFLTNGFKGGIPSHNQIIVSYMDKDAVYDEEKLQWVSGSATPVKNSDYAGNLLFYTTENIDWAAMQKGDVIQGTFISTGTITVRQSMTLAGQLLADVIDVNAFFDGSGFRYVPFDPPILGFTPEVFASLVFKENDTFVPVPVKLSEKTKVNVYFDYCFEYLTNEYSNVASAADITVDQSEVNPYPFPLCSENKAAQVVIWAGTDSADVNSRNESIHINVKIDDVVEPDEMIRLHVMNLSGAVLDGNVREGYFDLRLQDAQKNPSTKPASVRMLEDHIHAFSAEDFFYKGMYEQSGITITVLPEKGVLTLGGEPVVAGSFIALERLANGDFKYINDKDEYSRDGVYTTFVFTVMDVEGNSSVSKQDSDLGLISIHVDPENDPPVLNESVILVGENTHKVEGSITATDVEKDSPVAETEPRDVMKYELSKAFDEDYTEEYYNIVSALFEVNEDGSVSVKSTAELDFETLPTYTLKVTVTDDAATTDGNGKKSHTGLVTISLVDENDAPEAEEQFFTVPEDAKGVRVHTVVPEDGDPVADEDDGRFIATDPDKNSAIKTFAELTYSIHAVEGSDEDLPFVIDENGVIYVKEDAELDYEKDSIYVVRVLVSDGGDGEDPATIKGTSVEVTIKLSDVNEKPEFDDDGKPSYVVRENAPVDTVLKSWTIIDPDNAETAENMSVTLVDNGTVEGAVKANDIFGVEVYKGEDNALHVNLFVKNNGDETAEINELLDFEEILKANGDSVFNVTITLTDHDGKTATLTKDIVVLDENEENVVAENQVFKVGELATEGTKVLPEGWVKEGDKEGVSASDIDRDTVPNGTLVYTIEDNRYFDIDPETGVITVKKGAEFDHETQPTIEVKITVADKGEPSKSSKAVVTVKIGDENETPKFNDDGKPSYVISENAPVKTILKSWTIIDPDEAETAENVSVTLVDNGTVEGAVKATDIFDVKVYKGDDDSLHVDLFVKNNGDETAEINELLDFEEILKANGDSVFNVTITLTDHDNESVSLTKDIIVLDENEENVVAEGQVFAVSEFAKGGDKALPDGWKKGDKEGVNASDIDRDTVPNGTLVYTIEDNKYFDIDPETGVITVKKDAEFDYETQPSIEVKITVADKGEPSKSSEATVTIKINDENEDPTIDDDGKLFYDVEENRPVDFVIKTWPIHDEDGYDGLEQLSVSFVDNKKVDGKVSAEDLFGIRLVSDDNDSMFIELFVKNNGDETTEINELLDFEAIMDARGDSVFNITLTLKDTLDGVASLTKDIHVRDINEAPTFVNKEELKKDGLRVDENSKIGDTVGVAVATDPDKWAELTYTLVDGDDKDGKGDAEIFKVDANGVITVNKDNALDYEKDSIYVVKVIVTDNGKDRGFENMADTVTVKITLNDKNENPEIIPDGDGDGDDDSDDNCLENCEDDPNDPSDDKRVVTVGIDENSPTNTVVFAYVVKDEDKGDLEKLAATLVQDGTTKPYIADSLFKIEVVPVDEASSKVVVSVRDGSKLDYEKIDSIYNVSVIVYDKTDKNVADTLVRIIKVKDVNEAPTFVNKEELKKDGLRVDENSKIGDTVGVAVATDPDKWAELTYTLADGDDKDGKGDAEIFKVDANGVITVNKDKALDYEKDSVYVVKVIVTDNGKAHGFENMADTVVVTITLNDKNENPEIIPDGDGDGDDDSDDNCLENCEDDPNDPSDDKRVVTVGIDENSPTNTVVFAYVVKDEDKGDLEKLAATLVQDGTTKPYIADSLFKIEVVPVDEASSKVVVSVRDGSKLDYEKIDSIYNVSVIVYDKTDKNVADTLVRIIKVKDVNEAPTFVNKEELKKDGLRVDENSKIGDTVGVAVATDPDKWAELTYTLADGDDKDGKGDAEIFKVDANGVITVNKDNALDYEKDSIYVVKVIVTDNGKAHGFENMADTVTVKITLNDKDENPTIVVDDDDNGKDDTEDDKKCVANCSSGSGDKDGKILTVGVEENVPTNTVVFEYVVEDPDEDQVTKLVPTLKDVNKTGVDSLFDVKLAKDGDKYKVVVFVKDSSKLDYETINPEHKVTLIVTDATDRQDSVVRIISVIDVNEAPVIVKQDFEFPEHNKKGSVVDTIKWGDDLDTKDPSFRDNMVIAVGGDTTLFAVDEAGVITTKKSFNYEDDKDSYILVVKVQDKKQPELFVVDTMHIALTNIKEDPYITSTEFEIPENPGNKDLIGTITSEDLDDPENKEERTYALIGTSEFVTVTEDGKILVKDSTKFDYETTPSFNIKVSVTDPTGIKKDTTITIKVGDVNEAPTVDDQKFTVNENIKTGDSVGKIVAEDPDTRKEYSELTFTPICETGSKACEKFDVKKDGTIKVAEPLDYETDSVYTIKVQVSDGTYADTATVTIKVKDVIEKSVVEITKVDNSDSTWTKKDIADRHDTLYTNIPDNTITWTQDGVEMSMDTTLHDGPNCIIITYKDPAKNEAGSDTVVIFFSDATPIVTVTAGSDATEADNIYTVVQGTDKADTNIYVNSNKNDVVVTVLDPASGKTDTFTVKVDLDTVHVSKDTYTQVNKVKGELILNENPSSGVSRVPMNDDQVKVSYEEKVDGKTYTVSYNTDKSGNPVKVPVVGSKGKIDSIEVITVSYVTTIGGKDVTISYKADALTGEALVTDTDGNLLTTAGVEAINKDPSKNPNKNPSSSSSGSHNSSSSSGSSSGSNSGSKVPQISTGALTVTYDYVDETTGNTVTVSYVVDEKGNIIKNDEGDTGYNVSYTFVNKYGNAASTSVFIVLDKVGPKVEILSPEGGAVIRSNFVNVVWSVDGVIQDTLTTQGLEKGFNSIVRFYKDKAGNEASDTIFVIMKDGKDLDVAVVNPVTEMTQDRVDRYYASNPPKEGETYAVSIKNPSTGKEVETLIGGSFDTKEGSGKEPYPGHSSHLGPTLAMDVKLPMVNDVGGMATLDDLLSSDGLVPLEGVDAKNSEKVTVEEYVRDYCSEKFQNKFNSDFKGKIDQANLYNSKMDVHIWIYTNLGGFVDYYSFTQKLNDPSYTNDAALLNAYFEMKPDKDGNVHTENGKLLATGSYLYKVQVNLRSELQCTLPPVKDPTGKKKGDVIKTSEDMLKPFGYKRPPKK
ncbi:MAG: cadherin repeat domain-containing protein [Fibrobacter sp.]|nr:cadherin repeat domain-containing protein [Fibrobacter sp.]